MRSELGSDQVLAVAKNLHGIVPQKQRFPAHVSVFRYRRPTELGVSVWRLAYAVQNPLQRVFGQKKIEVFLFGPWPD
jgi:hypothetical protein